MPATTTKTYGRPAYVLTPVEIDWRIEKLSKLGASDADAAAIAASDVDVWDVKRLLDMKCPLALAFEILR